MRYVSFCRQLNILKGKKVVKRIFPVHLLTDIVQVVGMLCLDVSLLFCSNCSLLLTERSGLVQAAVIDVDQADTSKTKGAILIESESFVAKGGCVQVKNFVKIDLIKKYRGLAGYYYYPNVQPYLPIIERVLKEKGLDRNVLFIQAMFFIGQRESHWNTGSVSSSIVGGGHPTGIFQFLPGTFRSVSNGNIFNAEDQIRAYVTMVQRGRVREYGTLYLPGLSLAAKQYVMSY